VLIVGGALFTAAHLWYRLRLTPTADYLGAWLPGQFLNGAAIGLILPALSGAAVAGLPSASLGSGNAAQSAIRQLASIFGVATGVLLIGATNATLPRFLAVHTLLAAAGLLTALLAWPIRTATPRVTN
jgi:hypothetical protein